MRRFLRDRETAFEVAVERHAILQQIVDACAGLARQTERDAFVDEPAADRDGIGCV